MPTIPNLSRLFLAFCLLAVPAHATKHAPLPEALRSAKTAFIDNESGDQSITDSAFQALAKDSHLKVVSSRDSADVVLNFSTAEVIVDGDTVPRMKMVVYASSGQDPLFQTTERRTPFMPLHSAATKCVNDLIKRLSETQ